MLQNCADGSIYSLKQQILWESHNTPFAGHPGFNKTYAKVKSSFFWPSMRSDILLYVRECLQCQQVKVEQKRLPGELQPLDVPGKKWESISMDFITKLPTTRGSFDTIFVVVYRLMKTLGKVWTLLGPHKKGLKKE